MSQRALEAALGRLICDDAFRRAFFEDAGAATFNAGFALTPVELRSLGRIAPKAIETFVCHVDECVRRAEVPAPPRSCGRDESNEVRSTRSP